MPHKVTSFFKSSTTSLENQVSSLKKAAAVHPARRSTSPALSSRTSHSSDGAFSSASSLGQYSEAPPTPPLVDEVHDRSRQKTAKRMGPRGGSPRRIGSPAVDKPSKEQQQQQQQHHSRLSLAGLHLGRSSKEVHSTPARSTLDWKLESPPAVLYGDTEQSTGALVSGQLCLDVKEEEVEIESFTAKLNIHVTQKRPFAAHCNECANQYTEIKSWNFLTNPIVLKKGNHQFPVSVLLGGHLPATTNDPVVAIAYEFEAEAVPKSDAARPEQKPTSITLKKSLDVKRSMPVPEVPHHSVRIFPPTNIKASVHYAQVIHPIGSNTLTMRLDGISKVNSKTNTIEIWKLKKVMWKLEETVKTVAPACEKHTPKESTQQVTKKGLARHEMRVIGEKTLFSGWKSDYSNSADAAVELEVEYAVSKGSKFTCDMKSRDGSEVSHQLMVEMVVSQEWAPINKPQLVTQTGVGRILRMHFATIVTETGGLGISWDNEAPPIYQEVPPSPPAYSEETRIALQQAMGGHCIGTSATECVPEVDEAIVLDAVGRRGSNESRT